MRNAPQAFVLYSPEAEQEAPGEVRSRRAWEEAIPTASSSGPGRLPPFSEPAPPVTSRPLTTGEPHGAGGRAGGAGDTEREAEARSCQARPTLRSKASSRRDGPEAARTQLVSEAPLSCTDVRIVTLSSRSYMHL